MASKEQIARKLQSIVITRNDVKGNDGKVDLISTDGKHACRRFPVDAKEMIVTGYWKMKEPPSVPAETAQDDDDQELKERVRALTNGEDQEPELESETEEVPEKTLGFEYDIPATAPKK